MATTKLVDELLRLTKYRVISDRGVETIRTDKRAAQQDIGLLKDIMRRHAWIESD